jgi:hypothetical protein
LCHGFSLLWLFFTFDLAGNRNLLWMNFLGTDPMIGGYTWSSVKRSCRRRGPVKVISGILAAGARFEIQKK